MGSLLQHNQWIKSSNHIDFLYNYPLKQNLSFDESQYSKRIFRIESSSPKILERLDFANGKANPKRFITHLCRHERGST